MTTAERFIREVREVRVEFDTLTIDQIRARLDELEAEYGLTYAEVLAQVSRGLMTESADFEEWTVLHDAWTIATRRG